jgi:hypothetical protein
VDEVVVVVVGLCICKCEVGKWAWAKNHKTKRDSSVSGVPCEMAVEGDGGRWWGGVDEVIVVVELCVHKCKAGKWAGGQKS